MDTSPPPPPLNQSPEQIPVEHHRRWLPALIFLVLLLIVVGWWWQQGMTPSGSDNNYFTDEVRQQILNLLGQNGDEAGTMSEADRAQIETRLNTDSKVPLSIEGRQQILDSLGN